MEELVKLDLFRLGEDLLKRLKITYAENQKAMNILNDLAVEDLEFSGVVSTELEKGKRSIKASVSSKNGLFKSSGASLIIVDKKPAPKKRKPK